MTCLASPPSSPCLSPLRERMLPAPSSGAVPHPQRTPGSPAATFSLSLAGPGSSQSVLGAGRLGGAGGHRGLGRDCSPEPECRSALAFISCSRPRPVGGLRRCCARGWPRLGSWAGDAGWGVEDDGPGGQRVLGVSNWANGHFSGGRGPGAQAPCSGGCCGPASPGPAADAAEAVVWGRAGGRLGGNAASPSMPCSGQCRQRLPACRPPALALAPAATLREHTMVLRVGPIPSRALL